MPGPVLNHMLPSCIEARVAQGAAANLPSLEFLTADTPVVAFDPVLKVGLNESLTDVSRNAQMLEWSSTSPKPTDAPSYNTPDQRPTASIAAPPAGRRLRLGRLPIPEL